ncbi:MAG TPA: metallo-mystery pair system four-Cys motif protein [Pseudomonadota bacterium]|nr:metallo-mystery pair system four-Cys motif protein [Pseudomonadota bacterium]
MTTFRITTGLALALLCGPLSACMDGHSHGTGSDNDDMQAADLGPTTSNTILLNFKPRVGTQPFACNQKFSGVGLGATATAEFSDFRLYVHDLRLVDTSGTEVPLQLEEDQKWQQKTVALLDFEDKTGACGGTASVNAQLRGVVPDGSKQWKGIRFKVGVPFAQNHGDAATAASPLNLTSMFWAWQSGYKFLRVEGQTTTSQSFIVHLGSTGCVKDGSGQVQSCSSPNRPEIALDGFDPKTQSIAVDVAALISGTDLGKSMECMSSPGTADCGPVFASVGLPYGGGAAGVQKLFRVE